MIVLMFFNYAKRKWDRDGKLQNRGKEWGCILTNHVRMFVEVYMVNKNTYIHGLHMPPILYTQIQYFNKLPTQRLYTRVCRWFNHPGTIFFCHMGSVRGEFFQIFFPSNHPESPAISQVNIIQSKKTFNDGIMTTTKNQCKSITSHSKTMYCEIYNMVIKPTSWSHYYFTHFVKTLTFHFPYLWNSGLSQLSSPMACSTYKARGEGKCSSVSRS